MTFFECQGKKKKNVFIDMFTWETFYLPCRTLINFLTKANYI